MRQVTSPTCQAPAENLGRRLARRTLGMAVAVALTITGSAAPAVAEDLVERQRQIRADAQAVRDELKADHETLGAAASALLESQTKLAVAQAELDDLAARLSAAEAAHAEIAERLRAEQDQLLKDQAAAVEAEARVDAQEALITLSAREAYQQQTDLVGFGVVLGSESTDQVAQRMQWDEVIFATSQARLEALDVVKDRLQKARDAQAATAASVAADQDASARTVSRITELTAQAEEQKTQVAELVAATEADRAAAQGELDADQARYDQLMADDAAISQDLMARAAAAVAGGVRYVTSVPPGQVWTDPKTYPVLATGPQVAVSTRGFTRPVAAAPGSAYGRRFHPILRVWRQHRGTDFGAGCGTPLYAAQAGRVVHVGPQGGFGYYTIIDHGVIEGVSVMTGYAHQSRWVVGAGQFVTQGQLIGYVGNTGLSTECHLHLQVYVNGAVTNPLSWIP